MYKYYRKMLSTRNANPKCLNPILTIQSQNSIGKKSWNSPDQPSTINVYMSKSSSVSTLSPNKYPFVENRIFKRVNKRKSSRKLSNLTKTLVSKNIHLCLDKNMGSLNTINLVEEEDTSDNQSQSDHHSSDASMFVKGGDMSFTTKLDDDIRTIVVKRVTNREIRFGNLSLGDDFAENFAEQLRKDHNIQKMILSNNRLTSRGALAILDKVSFSTTWLDLSQNPDIRLDTYKFLSHHILKDYRTKIHHLDLEGNHIGDYAVGIIWNVLAGDSSVKYLNLGRNNISDKGAAHIAEMVYTNISISAFFLSWNDIKSEGAILLFERLIENTHIKVLDISFNNIGSMHFCKTSWSNQISETFKANKSIMHIDLSYCGFTREDLDVLNSGLKYNHTILGIHMIGNQGGVDSFGFLWGSIDPPSSSQLISTISADLKAGEIDPKDLDLQKCTNCWIWEGWTPMTFKYIQESSNMPHLKPKEKSDVFLHLSVDNFEPDIMYPDKSKPGEYYKVRMVPATNIPFYFSLDGVPRFRTDLNTVVANAEEVPQLKIADENGLTLPWKLNMLLWGPQNRMKLDYELLEQLNWLPRPKRQRRKKKKVQKVKPKWDIDKSVFKKYKAETPAIVEKWFEFDWACSKIQKIIKSEEEQIEAKKVLKQNYHLIREWYKYYAGVSPWGIVPGIGQNAFNEIINATSICDNKRLKLADIDFEFIVTKAGNKKKALNPERWLIRYQFLEIFVRIAIHMYYKSKIVDTQAGSISKLLNEHLLPYFRKFDCHKWRIDNLWNLKCEEIFTKYHNVLQKLYNKYSGKYTMPGKARFMSIEEFVSLINDSEVLCNETAVGNAELGAQFNLSMTTQVNEVEKDKHLQMLFPEFWEALARVAAKIHVFPDIDREVLFQENQKIEETPILMRNRGSSVEGTSDEDSSKEINKEVDDVKSLYDSSNKPLCVKLEILIRILQLVLLENIGINKLTEDS